MQWRSVTTLLAALPLFAGCVFAHLSNQQIEWLTPSERIRILSSVSHLDVSFLVPPRTSATVGRPEPADIDTDRSYAIQRGRRHALRVANNDHTDRYQSAWKTKRVSLSRIEPGDEGTPNPAWEDGEWTLHLEFTGHPRPDPIDLRFRLRTAFSLRMY
jgi:hypothetical protein